MDDLRSPVGGWGKKAGEPGGNGGNHGKTRRKPGVKLFFEGVDGMKDEMVNNYTMLSDGCLPLLGRL